MKLLTASLLLVLIVLSQATSRGKSRSQHSLRKAKQYNETQASEPESLDDKLAYYKHFIQFLEATTADLQRLLHNAEEIDDIVDDTFAAADEDNNNVISFSEFQVAVSIISHRTSTYYSFDHLRSKFDELDTDHSNSLDWDEVRAGVVSQLEDTIQRNNDLTQKTIKEYEDMTGERPPGYSNLSMNDYINETMEAPTNSSTDSYTGGSGNPFMDKYTDVMGDPTAPGGDMSGMGELSVNPMDNPMNGPTGGDMNGMGDLTVNSMDNPMNGPMGGDMNDYTNGPMGGYTNDSVNGMGDLTVDSLDNNPMNGPMGGDMNGMGDLTVNSMDNPMDGPMGGDMNGYTNDPMNGPMGGPMGGYTNDSTNGMDDLSVNSMDNPMNGPMGGDMNGYTNDPMNGPMGGPMDGPSGNYTNDSMSGMGDPTDGSMVSYTDDQGSIPGPDTYESA